MAFVSFFLFFLTHLWQTIVYVAPFVVILCTVVFVHEFGHFAVGRWCGAKVEVFSIGMGPELLGFTDRRGARWRLSAIPLGGYVRFAGDRNLASAPDAQALARMSETERRGSLAGQPLPARAAIVAAGPVANLFAAVVVFSGLAYCLGDMIVPPRVDSVVAGSPAEQAGFQKGDLIKSVDGRAVATYDDIFNFISLRSGEAIAFVVERDGRETSLVAAPALSSIDTPVGPRRAGRLGVIISTDPDHVRVFHPDPLGAARDGLVHAWTIVRTTGEYVGRVLTARASPDQLSGPVGIAQVSNAAASLGLVALVNLAAILSLSLGVMNLLPVPMLDGGHLLFYAIEAARGRALSRRAHEYGLRFGATFVLGLTAFVTLNDLWRLFTA